LRREVATAYKMPWWRNRVFVEGLYGQLHGQRLQNYASTAEEPSFKE
jgi:hypothetical protein